MFEKSLRHLASTLPSIRKLNKIERYVRVSVAGILSCSMTISFVAESSHAMNDRPQKNSKPALEELRQMGQKIADAVLAKDIPALLNYDRRDWRSQDQKDLKHQNSELYCYLFDSSCISSKKERSVYEKMSRVRQLGIKVIDGGKSSYNRQRYAFLFFYDRSAFLKRCSDRRNSFVRKDLIGLLCGHSQQLARNGSQLALFLILQRIHFAHPNNDTPDDNFPVTEIEA